MTVTAETAKLPLLLKDLRLPTFKRLWPEFCDRADREGWPAGRLLAALCELELDERGQRRVQRHLAEARLPSGKTLDAFDFAAVPSVSQSLVRALAESAEWLREGRNLLAFGPPGVGKTHLVAAIGHELVHRGHRVLMARAGDLVQRLQRARRDCVFAQEIARLAKFDLVILDDIGYVRKDQAEASALFELVAARYEIGSIAITANRPFGEWDEIFPDPAMTVAAIDRLVHRSTIFEMNAESYRRREAQAAKRTKRPVSSRTKAEEERKETECPLDPNGKTA